MLHRRIENHNRIATLLLALWLLILCGMSSGCTDAEAKASQLKPDTMSIADELLSGVGNLTMDHYSRWLNENYSSGVFTRQMWISDLMETLGQDSKETQSSGVFEDEELYACRTLFLSAYENGILDGGSSMEPYAALTRRYVATTLVNALGYTIHNEIYADDLYDDDGMMNTAVYYGFFLPDSDDMAYPESLVTESEYREILGEVSRYVQLHGKRLLSFGDSIMYGKGNDESGIADILGEKYGMIVTDYSVSGATFGIYDTRSHIPDQIKEAVKAGDQADIILIDGGTNDMVHVELGKMQEKYNVNKKNEKTFAGGMEYSLWLLQKNWEDVPVLYIRAHNMQMCKDETERQFGEYGLRIMEKWGIPYVDIYSDTALNTQKSDMRNRYTAYKDSLGEPDSIHPNALGYAKYYLPLTSQKVVALLTDD